MEKAHDIQSVSFIGTRLRLQVDGKSFEIGIAKYSKVLVTAKPERLAKFEVSPSGYGIHWPQLDEDLSIDGLIGIKHSSLQVHV